MTGLADPHNFGRRVVITDDYWFYKPRTVFWERLFLEGSSPLRRTIDHIFAERSIRSPFAAIPSLKFRATCEEGPGVGEVQGLFPNSLTSDELLTAEELNLIGSVVGLLTWLGVTDLHVQNMALGRDAASALVCCPLDLECLFHDHQLVSQTILIPSSLTTPQTCGLAPLLTMRRLFSGTNAAALVDGFLSTVDTLVASELTINQTVFGNLDTVQRPVRLLVRPTADYLNALHSGHRKGFTKAEREQLDRGDVPYFFRYPGSDKIMYWSEQWKACPADLPTDSGKQRRFELRMITSSGLAPSPGKGAHLVAKAGALQLARVFDPGADGTWSHGRTTLAYDNNDLIVQLSSATAWRAARKQLAGSRISEAPKG